MARESSANVDSDVPEFCRQGLLESLGDPQEVDEDSDDQQVSLMCSRDKLRCNTPRSLFVSENRAAATGGREDGADDDLRSEASADPAPRGNGRSFGRVGSAAVLFAALAVLAIGGQRFGSSPASNGRLSLREAARGPPSGSAPVGAEPRRMMLVERPEFVELVVGQVHSVHSNKTKAWLRLGVAGVCKAIAELLDKHLEPKPKQALYDVNLTHSQFQDLAKLLEAGRDPRVGQLGLDGLEVIRRHALESPLRTDERLQEMLRGRRAEISILVDQLLPDSTSKLLEQWVTPRFGHENAGEDGDGNGRFGASNQRPAGAANQTPGVPLWRGMLHETVLASLRNGSSSGNGGDVANEHADAPSAVGPESDFRRLLATYHPDFSRRLQDAPAGEIPGDAVDTWFHPHLNVLEFSFSMAGLSMASVFEVLFHIEYFDHNFRMPWWAWMLVVVPAEGGTVATCFFGFSLWCQIVLGFVGLHEIELMMSLMIWHR